MVDNVRAEGDFAKAAPCRQTDALPAAAAAGAA